MHKLLNTGLSRRQFVTGVTAGTLLYGLNTAPSLASLNNPPNQRSANTLKGNNFDLNIGYQPVNFTGQQRIATAVNGGVPAPILHWREGERVTLRVTNHLAVDSSIHWHGMILPTDMDGVPGLSFKGIKPGETFEYQFDINQSGTYWYHSHSGFQEQTGAYGAIVITPKEPDPVSYDREYVVMLSDWSDEAPEDIYANLKRRNGYYNYSERTAGDLWRDIKQNGVANTWNARGMWNRMRMSESDISDVTGHTYTFLMNGNTPEDGWQALFNKGEKIRLRFINGAAMTIFDVRIPGLKMTVVASDGQNIQPVTVDEFRIGVAETYDVVVEPSADMAYTLFAQTIDRTGYARGVLTPDASWTAKIPEMDHPPVLGHRDMGMDMSGMGHEGHDMGNMKSTDDMAGMDHSQHDMGSMKDTDNMAGMDHSQHDMGSMKDTDNMAGMDHSQHDMSNMQSKDDMAGMDHSQHDMSKKQGITQTPQHMMSKSIGKAGFGSNNEINHVATEFGPHVDSRAESPMNGLSDPGIGLRQHQSLYGRRVLTYADIRNLTPTIDKRQPSREIELHLTGNMARYMWSINGINFADADPIQLKFGERVRIILVNDTMMTHPVHLHGVWSELETGDADYIPRKHTIIVQPGAKISYLVTADARGRWAYHCHLLYHMPGMFREVRIV